MNTTAPRETDRGTEAAAGALMLRRGLPIRYRIVWLIVALAVASVYFWLTKSGWAQFEWKRDLDGYYDLLARGFLNGHLRLPVEPRPELLALPDPWDARFNVPYRLLDLALYGGHYYLYHGAAPALLFFAPWRLLTGHDLPESFAVFVMCLAGYLVLSELLLRVPATLPTGVPLWMFTLFLLTLGFGETLPYLLQRAMVYEVAVSFGFLFTSCGFFCLFKSLTSVRRRVLWLFLCGSCFGLAAGGRPYLVLAVAPAFVIVLRSGQRPLGLGALLNRETVALCAPAAICCLCIAGYNYARFGNPFEFGLRYQMANPSYQNIKPALVNILPGLSYFLFSPPSVDPVFPFVRFTFRSPFELSGYPLPARYFNGGTSGIVFLCPLLLLAFAPSLFALKRSRFVATLTVQALTTYSVLCIFFVASLGLLSQEYELDFQPYLVLAGCISAGLLIGRTARRMRIWANFVVVLTIAWSIFANMAMAVQGPYDQFVQAHPESYFRLAQWFSPVERFRPLLNPRVHVYGRFYFPVPCFPGEQPLISIGVFAARYQVSEVCMQDGRLRIVSAFGEPRFPQIQVADIPLEGAGFKRIDLDFSPQDKNMTVRWNGKVILTHHVPFLFVARSQVRVGWDDAFGRRTEFAGRVVAPVAPEP